MRINFSRQEVLIMLLSITTSLFAFSLSYAEEKNTEAPIIIVKWETIITINTWESFIDEGVIAYDFQQWFLTEYVNKTWSVNVNVPWVYKITYGVRDVDGNYAPEVTRTVTVIWEIINVTKPVIENYEIGILESDNSLKISFKTSENTQAVIGYGLDGKYTMFSTPEKSFTKSSHAQRLNNIEPWKRYTYIIYVKNVSWWFDFIKNTFIAGTENTTPNNTPTIQPSNWATLWITNLQDWQKISKNQTINFTFWNTEIIQWLIRTGTESDSRKYDESARLTPETTSYTLKNLPNSGTVVVALWYKAPSWEWSVKSYSFTMNEEIYTSIENDSSSGNPSNGNWDNTETPPKLSNPEIVEVSDTTFIKTISDFNRVWCEWLFHLVNIPKWKDAKVVMKQWSKPLKYPIWVSWGRNVQIIGLDLQPIIQAGCDIWEATQVRVPDKNIHPRLPGGIALRIEQSGTTFIEGLNIDLKWMEADCIVLRDSEETSVWTDERKLYVVNSRCTGYEWLDSDESDIGDGIHGDFYQNQWIAEPTTLVFENVVVWGSSNGITSHKWKQWKLKTFKLRNYAYQLDERYHGDDNYEKSLGLVFTATLENSSSGQFENVWINDGRYYGIARWYHSTMDRVWAVSQSNYILKDPEFFKWKPKNEFAPLNKVWGNYISPF